MTYVDFLSDVITYVNPPGDARDACLCEHASEAVAIETLVPVE